MTSILGFSPSVRLIAVACGLGCVAISFENPSFAGWIKSSNCPIKISRGKASPIPYAATQCRAVRVYVGDHIVPEGRNAEVNLILFGQGVKESGEYTVPSKETILPAGILGTDADRSALLAWIQAGGGRAPGVIPPTIGQETDPVLTYHVLGLVDLPESQSKDQVKFGFSISVGAENVTYPAALRVFRANSEYLVKVTNPNGFPVYVTLVDTRSSPLGVQLLYPLFSQGQTAVSARSSQTIQARYSLQPDKGREQIRVIASTVPLDLGALQTTNAMMDAEGISYRPAISPSDDPLVNLMRESGANSEFQIAGKWASGAIDVGIE